MSTKLQGDIVEQAAIIHALKHGWSVLNPVGDRLSVDVFTDDGSEIDMVESRKRQRKPRSSGYRDAWNLITQWAAQRETSV